MADILETIKQAGVVGAGGAGFPTHVKLRCNAEIVIANGAECEPLLNVDQYTMRDFADEIVEGLEPGRQVVAQGAGFLGDGDRVRVVADAEAKAP